jgi:hypothetical protein
MNAEPLWKYLFDNPFLALLFADNTEEALNLVKILPSLFCNSEVELSISLNI